MFLNELNKEQAVAFINLVTEFSLADKRVKEEEKALIDSFCTEMSLDKNNLGSVSLEEALNTAKSSSQRIINIMYFELIRVGLADGEYEFGEVEFLEKIADELNISRAKKIEFANYFYKFTETQELNSEEAKKEAENLLK